MKKMLAASMLLFAMVACSSKTSTDTGSGSADVNAVVKEYSVTATPASASAGKVTFSVKNSGTMDHEFVVFRTDLAADALPVTADGIVDEKGEGITLIDEIAEFPDGQTKTKAIQLPAGRYVLICNVVGHYKLGMHTEFTTT